MSPEVIHVTAPRENPCPTTIPAFEPAAGANSYGLDQAFAAWMTDAKLIMRCWMKGAPPEKK